MSNAALSPPPEQDLYEVDFYRWTREQARLLQERRFHELDLTNLIDEVLSVGASDKREIRSRLSVILTHLLKWKYQPGARSGSWRSTLGEQRDRLNQVLDDSPSLRKYPSEVFQKCYPAARLKASEQTGIDFTLFPEASPFTVEQALDPGYLPKEPDLLDQS